jgi:hypothetical protein
MAPEEHDVDRSSGGGTQPPPEDPHLASLVQLANAFGLEQELVVTLSGQMVAGTLIGAKAYFDELAGTLQGQDPDDTLRGSLAGRFRKRGEELAEWGAGSKLGDLDPVHTDHADLAPMPEPHYVHLRGASVVTWPRPGQRLPLWRCRLADVAGWSVGPFEDDPAYFPADDAG